MWPVNSWKSIRKKCHRILKLKRKISDPTPSLYTWENWGPERWNISKYLYCISKRKLLSLQKFSLHTIFQEHVCENFSIKSLITEKILSPFLFVFHIHVQYLFYLREKNILSSMTAVLHSFQSITVLFQTPFQMLYFYILEIVTFPIFPKNKEKWKYYNAI